MTTTDMAAWLRKLDRATVAHEKTRTALENVVADARAAGVPLITIAKHTPWSREWCRKIADRIDAERPSEAEAQQARAERVRAAVAEAKNSIGHLLDDPEG